MPAFGQPRPAATTTRAAIAAVVAMLGGATASAEPSAGSGPIEALVGRWSGNGFIRGVELAPPIILDIRACGSKLCASPVRPDGGCAAEPLIEIERAGTTAERTHPARDAGTHRGRMARAGLPAAELTVVHVAAAPDRPAQLHIREAAGPLYARRLPDAVNLSLRYQGATACEAKPTS